MSSPKVYVIVGISHSGKSSIVKNTFIRNRTPELKRDLMRYSELDDCILIGWYGPDFKRREGTDNIERKHVGLLASQILNLLPLGKDIVLEGVKAISRPMMNRLIENGICPAIVLLRIPVDTSMQRQTAFGTQPNPKVTSSDHKKAQNFYNDFRGRVETILIDTESCQDFNRLSLTDLVGAKMVEHIIPLETKTTTQKQD